MISIQYMGRVGNCLIQYSAAKILASRFGLSINPESNKYISQISKYSVNLYMGSDNTEKPKKEIVLLEDEFLKMYSSSSIETANYIIKDSFQFPDFVSVFRDEIKSTVRILETPRDEESVLVHIRLGDCDGSPRRLPYGYYREALLNSSFTSGVICSDSPDHPDVKSLAREFSLNISNLGPSQILQTCNKFGKVILSEGTFSWWIGLLSEAPQVIINKRRRESLWHGDIFVFPEWKETNYCS